MFISQPIEIYGSKSDINGMFSLFSKIFIRKVKVSLVTFHGYLLL